MLHCHGSEPRKDLNFLFLNMALNRVGNTSEWYTPLEISIPLGEFDLDPCSPENPKYPIAKKIYTINDDGLKMPWFGRVWLNPPYGDEMKYWVERMSHHRNGIALVFARLETEAFQDYIFPHCDSMLFIRGRVHFLDENWKRNPIGGTAPSVLIAYGEENVDRLDQSKIPGKHILVNCCPVIIIGISPSWKDVVKISLGRLNGKGSLQEIYDVVEQVAPDKIRKNKHFQAKIRQVLQNYFIRINKGIYSRDQNHQLCHSENTGC
jgi:hypothetical protein